MKNMNTVQHMTSLPAHVDQVKTLDQAKSVKRVCAFAALAMLGAYTVQRMNSVGSISSQEMNLIIIASALTLLLLIPIIALNIYFVSRHRASDTSAKASPQRSHSVHKEIAVWAVPVVIVALLGVLGWSATHSLDMYKPIDSKVAAVHAASGADA